MLIALISGSAGDTRCGVGDYTYEFAQHLALDSEVHLYYARGHGPQTPPYPKLTSLHLHELDGFSALGLLGLTRQLRDGGYDIIHLQYPSRGFGKALGPLYIPKSLYGMKSRSRIVLSLHEWTTSHPLRRTAVGEMLPHIDAIVVMCEGELDALGGKLGDRPMMMLPVGNILMSRAELDAVWDDKGISSYDALPAPTGITGREPLSLFHYGLPAHGKQVTMLLESLAIIRKAGMAATLALGGDYPPGETHTEELLTKITELELAEAVELLQHIPRGMLAATACRYTLGVFPFAEGFSTKRSSLISISHLDLPLVVGAGSSEDHPYYAPDKNTAASLAVLLTELLKGKLETEWKLQVNQQREYCRRFSFDAIASGHLDFYRRLRRVDA